MSSDVVIEVNSLSKCYEVYAHPRDRLKQLALPPLRRALGLQPRNWYQEFWALRDISFTVERGEAMGVVGRNGSGKSTLLQILYGVLEPTAGEVRCSGRMGALLELGSGFDPEFSGRENVYMNAALLGLSSDEIDQRFDAIAAFADIGEFIERPVKTYSSGMALRLAFAVQAQIDPDILIVDEALVVGDARFQAKCFDRLRKLRDNGTSILLVTHSSEQIVTHCNRALLLDAGEMRQLDSSRKVINSYFDLLFGRSRKHSSGAVPATKTPARPLGVTPTPELSTEADCFASRPGYNPHEYRWGDGRATLLDFAIFADGNPLLGPVDSLAQIELWLSIRFNDRVVAPILGVTIKTKEGVTVAGCNSLLRPCGDLDQRGEPGSVAMAKISFSNRLISGDFFISLGLASRDGEEVVPHDRRYDAVHLIVTPSELGYGLADLSIEMDLIGHDVGDSEQQAEA